jgi:hypothetical protein
MRGCGGASDSYPLRVGPSPPPPRKRLGLGWPFAASQTLLASPNPLLRKFSAFPNRARQPGTAAWAPSRSCPTTESSTPNVAPSGSSLHPWHRRAIDELVHRTMSPGQALPTPSEKPCPSRRSILSHSPPPRGHLSLSLRGFIQTLTYPLRRSVLRDAIRDAHGDRRLAFVLFSKWANAHTTVAGLSAISWAYNKLDPPAKTPSPDLLGWDGSTTTTTRGAGPVLPAPHKGVEL